MKPTAEQIKTIALIVDGEAWKAIEDGRDALPGSLWGFRRDIAMEKAMAIAALSVQPAAAVVGEPVGMGVFRNGEMIGFVGIGDEFKLPEDTDERRPIYDEPSATDGWQPIETAPKDGTRVLIHCDLASGFNVQEASYVGGYDSGDVWLTAVGCVYNVKFWRPLPAPPALGGASHE